MNADASTLLKACAEIDTSAWSDALDELGISGVASGVPQRSGQGRFAAFAVTASLSHGPLGSIPRAEFAVGRMIAAVGPGQVLMMDAQGVEISCFGGLASTATRMQGVSAVVIDGGCRDLAQMQATGLWLAARHVTPVTGKKRLRLDALNVPVTIGGVPVSPGDLVIGDETGLIVVPAARIAEAKAAADRIVATDAEVERRVHAGEPFGQAAASANYI
jgi:regulator of RNase E activity RraA